MYLTDDDDDDDDADDDDDDEETVEDEISRAALARPGFAQFQQIKKREQQEKALSNVDATGSIDMEGVVEYPPIRVMPAEALVRPPAAKRKSPPDSTAASSLQQAVASLDNVRIEQDDSVLMEGQGGVWDVQDSNEGGDNIDDDDSDDDTMPADDYDEL